MFLVGPPCFSFLRSFGRTKSAHQEAMAMPKPTPQLPQKDLHVSGWTSMFFHSCAFGRAQQPQEAMTIPKPNQQLPPKDLIVFCWTSMFFNSALFGSGPVSTQEAMAMPKPNPQCCHKRTSMFLNGPQCSSNPLIEKGTAATRSNDNAKDN